MDNESRDDPGGLNPAYQLIRLITNQVRNMRFQGMGDEDIRASILLDLSVDAADQSEASKLELDTLVRRAIDEALIEGSSDVGTVVGGTITAFTVFGVFGEKPDLPSDHDEREPWESEPWKPEA